MDTLKTVTTSRQVLEETPARSLIFLRAAGTSVPITAALATRGYTPADHQQGWDLLHRVSGYDRIGTPVDTNAASEAIATLDAWDEPNFRIINVTLLRYAREQAAFVFHDLSPATGASPFCRSKRSSTASTRSRTAPSARTRARKTTRRSSTWRGRGIRKRSARACAA